MQMFGVGQASVAQIVEGLFHRVKGVALAGEDAELDNLVELLG